MRLMIGCISHIYNSINFEAFSIGFGYIAADKNIGSGSLINNPWDPFEEDDFHTQLANARTGMLPESVLYVTRILRFVYGKPTQIPGMMKMPDMISSMQLLPGIVIDNVSLEAGYVHVNTTDGVEEGFDKAYINAIVSF